MNDKERDDLLRQRKSIMMSDRLTAEDHEAIAKIDEQLYGPVVYDDFAKRKKLDTGPSLDESLEVIKKLFG